ncbi:glutathione peroxidase [Spirosoma montaniterrae]|uniref:Glutathione peroxidase n=1 Tax=Spirosoma montaniterrae TaxID=1178516 RepID=A0A1P9WX22_9BACT|nr:glutathione peroxidase [Spirosoma montaniterrae]AQG79921.1 glutathione peroxidase [Spirosoma montaniterrae]
MKKPLILTLTGVAVVVALTSFMSLSTLVKGIFSDKKASAAAPANAEAPTKSLYDFTVKSIDGKPVALSGFKGKKVVVLNVASKCGFTPQYADWEKFYKAHGDKIVVLGFPANNFANQESGSNDEIATFCQKNYGVSFPMFEKVSVVGDDQSPLYKWLSTKSMNGWNDKAPTWNFCKYVINEKGELTNFFASGVKPDDVEFKKAVGI